MQQGAGCAPVGRGKHGQVGRKEINPKRRSLPSGEMQRSKLLARFFCKMKDGPLAASGKYFPTPFVQQFLCRRALPAPQAFGLAAGERPAAGAREV